MTKEKIRRVLKRLPYILKIIKEGKTEENIYINHYTEKIIIDGEVKIIVEILEEIIAREPTDSWILKVLQKIQEGKKDVSIIIKSPVSRAKYYMVKERLIEKIYACCVYKGLVSYEDILSEEIG